MIQRVKLQVIRNVILRDTSPQICIQMYLVNLWFKVGSSYIRGSNVQSIGLNCLNGK